ALHSEKSFEELLREAWLRGVHDDKLDEELDAFGQALEKARDEYDGLKQNQTALDGMVPTLAETTPKAAPVETPAETPKVGPAATRASSRSASRATGSSSRSTPSPRAPGPTSSLRAATCCARWRSSSPRADGGSTSRCRPR